MKKLTFSPSDSSFYAMFYAGCCAERPNNPLNKTERREWEKLMDAIESIGVKPLQSNQTFSMRSEGGEILLEDSQYNLALSLAIDFYPWPTISTREVNKLEDFLKKAIDTKPQLVKD